MRFCASPDQIGVLAGASKKMMRAVPARATDVDHQAIKAAALSLQISGTALRAASGVSVEWAGALYGSAEIFIPAKRRGFGRMNT